MKTTERKFIWHVSYVENDKPRPPRTEEERRYQDRLIDEYEEDEQFAWDFAQYVIEESQREMFNKNDVPSARLLAREAKNLGEEARKLLQRIVEGRSHKKQLVLVAFQFSDFCRIVDSTVNLKKEMMQRLADRRKKGIWRRRYEALKEACFDNGIFGMEGIINQLKGTDHAKLFKGLALKNSNYFSSYRKEYRESHPATRHSKKF